MRKILTRPTSPRLVGFRTPNSQKSILGQYAHSSSKIVFDSPNIWDVAGGIVLVKAAGGTVRQQRDGHWATMQGFVPEQPSVGGEADLRFWRHPVIVGAPEAVERMCAG